MSTQLLCTFTDKTNILKTLRHVLTCYSVIYNKIFIYENVESKTQMLCVYNIDRGNSNNSYLQDTILVHRKKQTNTLYTINALNELIKECNNGILDINYPIEWTIYTDYAIIITNCNLVKIPLKYKETFQIKK